MKFSDTLFIGVGETGAFFTLRQRYLHTWYEKNARGEAVAHDEIRSFHHWNLAQDADEAFAKATEQAGKMGMALTTTRARLTEKMREIERSTAEQMEARRKREAEQEAKWAAEDAARRARWAMEDADLIAAGRYPFGRLKGEEFGADVGYMNWLANRAATFEADSTMAKLAARIIELYGDELLPKPKADATIGKAGERITVSGVVTSCRFHDDGFGGGYHITNFVTDNGELLVAFGSFEADAGDRMEIKATVKRHGEYQGQAQTIVNRIKEVFPVKDWIVETKVYDPTAPDDGQYRWYPVSIKVKAAKDKAVLKAGNEFKAMGVAMITHGSELIEA